MKQAFFHFRANTQVGMGHAMRCLNLAHDLLKAGHCVCFMIDQTTSDLIAERVDCSVDIKILQHDHIPEMYEILQDAVGPHLFVVDHYAIGAKEETQIINQNTRTLVIDDLANRTHHCDLLLDQTIGRDASDYLGLCPDRTTFLLGPKYALLDENYKGARTTQLPRQTAPQQGLKVALSFGGADPENITGQILSQIKGGLPIQKIDLIVGKANPHRENLEMAKTSCPYPVHIHQDIKDMPNFFRNVDFVIGAGGVSATERACLGIPSAFIEIADNQKMVIRGFSEKGAGINLGKPEDISPDKISELVMNFSKTPHYQSISQQAAILCDGLGVERVVKSIENLYT